MLLVKNQLVFCYYLIYISLWLIAYTHLTVLFLFLFVKSSLYVHYVGYFKFKIKLTQPNSKLHQQLQLKHKFH